VDGLENPQICEVAPDDAPDSEEGPIVSIMGNHEVRLTSHVYNPGDNTTTITYRVTSGSQPSISHWVLGVPPSVRDDIISVSEQYEWTDNDPRTGIAGLKFDTGYETANLGNTMLTSFSGRTLLSIDGGLVDQVSRDITLLVSGQYEFSESEITVSLKAGGDVYTSTIAAPIKVEDGVDNPGSVDCVQ